jgi:predicted protein tyrosine phosphatase
MKKFLFVCSQNKLRSRTAEDVFSEYENLEVRSAGTNHDAVIPLSPEDVIWAEYIFVMENHHKNKLMKKFKQYIRNQRIIVLDIPDIYEYMELELIDLLKRKVRNFF